MAWLSTFRDSVHEHRDYLTELDAAIGDADHGTNLTRGMDAVMQRSWTPTTHPDTAATCSRPWA